jgi:hypothetical protein
LYCGSICSYLLILRFPLFFFLSCIFWFSPMIISFNRKFLSIFLTGSVLGINFLRLIFFITVLGGGTLWIYKNPYQIYYTWIRSHQSFNSWNNFNRYHFYIYMHLYTVFAPYSPSYPVSPPPSPSHWYQCPLGQHLFRPLVFQFCKRKKRYFCLFEIKVATQGCSLWYFHVYMYYKPNWFISSIFLHSTLVLFL